MELVFERLREEFKGSKAIITGGLGFIGSNLAVQLVNLGADITLYTKTMSKLRNIREVEPKVEIIHGEITDYDKLASLIRDKNYVFHLAAQTSNITSMEKPFLDLDANVKGTLTVLEACRSQNQKAPIVSVGTVTQIGKPEKLPVDESHSERPLTVYDVDKLACEKYFGVYNAAFGLKTTYLRLSTIFGERQQIDNPRIGIVNLFIAKALRGETIKIFGEGQFLRDYLYVGNVVDALLLSAASPSAAGGAFQVVSGRGIPFAEMVKTVVSTVNELTGQHASYEHAPWPSEWTIVDVGSFVGSYEKFSKATEWYPRISFEEGIKRTVEFYSKHLSEYLPTEG
jgi:UDP-glucose 4-epimerase